MKDYSYININKGHERLAWNISSKHSFFEDEFHYMIDEESIIFQRAFLHTTGKRYKCHKDKSNWFISVLTTRYELPLGKFYFDIDESTEDEIVIYFTNNQ
jgi:hypothetical protein